MPTGTLPAEGKALWEKVYDKALKGSCNDDKECAARTAWSAVKGAGWSKDSDGKWHKKTVYSEFSLAITRASYDKTTNRMNFRAVASDTDEDFFKDNMTLELFRDFIDRINRGEQPPEKYRSNFWNGGLPYVSMSHYPDLDGRAVPGVVEKVYIDGNRLKSTGYFLDTPLGRACFKSVCNDLYGEDPHPEGKIRISIAFLDFMHRHKSNGFVFDRKSGSDDLCMECIMELLSGQSNGVEFLRGILIHEALTRVPANARTILEVDKSMAIKTRKDDALSIVGDDEEAKSEIEEIALAAEELIGRSELVIKSDVEDETVNEDHQNTAEAIVEESKASADEKDQEPSDEEDDMEEKESLVESKAKKVTGGSHPRKSSVSNQESKSMVDDEIIAKMAADVAEIKSLLVEEPKPEHPLDELWNVFRSAYDSVIANGGTPDDVLQALQTPFAELGNNMAEKVRSLVAPVSETSQPGNGITEDAVVSLINKTVGPQFEELKALLRGNQPVVPAQNDIREQIYNRRSFLPSSSQPQQNMVQSGEKKSQIRSLVERTT